jgi:hypothetical protein
MSENAEGKGQLAPTGPTELLETWAQGNQINTDLLTAFAMFFDWRRLRNATEETMN